VRAIVDRIATSTSSDVIGIEPNTDEPVALLEERIGGRLIAWRRGSSATASARPLA
jgi:hypothetical protein